MQFAFFPRETYNYTTLYLYGILLDSTFGFIIIFVLNCIRLRKKIKKLLSDMTFNGEIR